MKDNSFLYRIKPLFLSLFLVIADQISKLWVVENIPVNTIYGTYLNDFLWIVHVRNTGVAFSLGYSFPVVLRIVLFVFVPVVIMVFTTVAIVKKNNTFLTRTQQYFAAGILGGGMGTIIDRIIRFDEGVVDFISVKFYGLLGMDRWPTFNISDSCVVIFVILLAVSVLFSKESKE